MTLLTRIKEQIIPVTVEAVILAVGFFTFTKMPPRGTAGDIIAWFMLLVAFCVVFSIFPALAIIYGWYTGKRAGAVLAGALDDFVEGSKIYLIPRSTSLLNRSIFLSVWR